MASAEGGQGIRIRKDLLQRNRGKGCTPRGSKSAQLNMSRQCYAFHVLPCDHITPSID